MPFLTCIYGTLLDLEMYNMMLEPRGPNAPDTMPAPPTTAARAPSHSQSARPQPRPAPPSASSFATGQSRCRLNGRGNGFDTPPSHRRDCHFDDIPSPSILKRLLKVEGGAAE